MNNDRELRPTFGQLVAARRSTLRLTQKELAALVHVSEKTIRNYEKGVAFPDPKQYRLLEFALGWEGDAINDALDGWTPETFEEGGAGILWGRLPSKFREAPAGSEDAWREAWRKKNAYQEEYRAAKEASENPKLRT